MAKANKGTKIKMFHTTRKNDEGQPFRQEVPEASVPEYERAGWKVSKKPTAPEPVEAKVPPVAAKA